MAKMLGGGTHSTLMLKLKFMQNKAILDITNKGTDTMIFKPKEMIGIIDLRLLGYYKIKQGILQQTLSRYYRFERQRSFVSISINCEHTKERKRTEITRGQISMVRSRWEKTHDR